VKIALATACDLEIIIIFLTAGVVMREHNIYGKDYTTLKVSK